MREYHFLTASISYYSGNNFKDLIDEEKEYGDYVYWHMSNHKIKVGDICFIYYSNLPDYSSRILFVGDVVDSDLGNNGKSICPDADGKRYIKMKLRPVSLEDKDMFSLDRLRNYYNLVPKKGQFSYMHVNIDKHSKLIEDVLASVKYTKKKLEHVQDYFNNNYCICEFGCKTFVEENGFFYIEKHHLVERNLIDKHKDIDDIDKLINNDKNLYNLCPNCHMKIHHAKIDERKKMIEKLYNINKDYYDNNFKELKGGKTSLEWLYDIYKCNK